MWFLLLTDIHSVGAVVMDSVMVEWIERDYKDSRRKDWEHLVRITPRTFEGKLKICDNILVLRKKLEKHLLWSNVIKYLTHLALCYMVRMLRMAECWEAYKRKNSNEFRICNSQMLKGVEEFDNESKLLDLSTSQL